MTTETPPTPETETANHRVLDVKRYPHETEADALAHIALRPAVQAAITLLDYNGEKIGAVSINTLVDDLDRECERVNKGDLSQAEALLMSQAHTLDAVFHYLARWARRATHRKALDTDLCLALKVQGQCRATLETLAEIRAGKCPKMTER